MAVPITTVPSAPTAIVHCQAGISRSTAAAYVLHATTLGPDREADALAAVLAVAPHAMPNRWVVRLADEALSRAGRLVAALDARFPR